MLKLLLMILQNILGGENISAPDLNDLPEPTNPQDKTNTVDHGASEQKEPSIDWTNPSCKISKYFTVKECLFLPQWNRLANESDGLNDEVKENILSLAEKMDEIREFFNVSISVHCWLRPTEYNTLVKGAKSSCHLTGKAIDFHVKRLDCDETRQKILDEGLLDSLELRMEDLPGSSWVHLDIGFPKPNRFFKP